MSEPFIGEIRQFPFDYAPEGWAKCQGQLLPINNNTALYSLIGTTYGGDGRTTFGLPDYRGHTAVCWGQTHWYNIPIGTDYGHESQTLPYVASHTHDFSGMNKEGDQRDPSGHYVAGSISNNGGTPYSTQKNITLNPETVSSSGASSPHSFTNMQPSLALNICIALQGLYPSRP